MQANELTEQELIHVLSLPDLSWQTCGPIIEQEGISTMFHDQGHWTAANLKGTVCAEGPTPSLQPNVNQSPFPHLYWVVQMLLSKLKTRNFQPFVRL